jgi:hypothetical protein
MAFPKISSECLLATITKASQQPQDVFAAEFMVDMLREQPDVMEVIVGLLEPWLTPQPEIETVDLAQAQDIILQSCFAVLGIVLKSLNAQQEADEMNEAWGENEEEDC